MSIRSVMLGLLLASLIAGFTFFNDFIIQQNMLIGTHLPAVVFGTVVVGLLVAGPAARRMGVQPLRPGEVAVVAALGLAACGWPGSGFWRYLPTVAATPAHWRRTAPAWQAQGVMSYLPGGAGEIAAGHVRDWPTFLDALDPAGDELTAPAAAAIWQRLDAPTRRLIETHRDQPPPDAQRAILAGVNAALAQPDLFSDAAPPDALPAPDAAPRDAARANRAILAAALPEAVRPTPRGGGVLVADGRPDPQAVDRLIIGRHAGGLLPLDGVPWAAWWPTLRLWVGSALCLGVAALCLAVIVHPQWSRRELLPYPIARFVEEIAEVSPRSGVPIIATRPAFWIAFAAVFALHLLNGLHAYFDSLPSITLSLPFDPLRELFPNASRVALSYGLFRPHLYFSVIAFAFFLSRSASLSLGLAHVVFIAFGTLLIANGVPMGYDKATPNKMNFLRLGAYVGMAVMIAYTGRRYYANVLAASLGRARLPETPPASVWAARGFILAAAAAVLLLTRGGLAWDLSIFVVGLVLLTWLVLSRIVCETGAFFVTTPFLPIAVILGLLGFEAMGPTGFLVVAIASWALIADPREAILPYLSNGLQMADREGIRPARSAPWLLVALVLSLALAGVVALTLAYEHGVASLNSPHSVRIAPTSPFSQLTDHLSNATATGTLADAADAAPLMRFADIDPAPGALWWTLLGLGLVTGCAVARLRLPWWPIHPVLFLMWGTYANANFAFSFLVGWAVKSVIVGSGGARAYGSAKPIMIGLIAGELIAALLWTVVGATYYFLTDATPPRYLIAPF